MTTVATALGYIIIVLLLLFIIGYLLLMVVPPFKKSFRIGRLVFDIDISITYDNDGESTRKVSIQAISTES